MKLELHHCMRNLMKRKCLTVLTKIKIKFFRTLLTQNAILDGVYEEQGEQTCSQTSK